MLTSEVCIELNAMGRRDKRRKRAKHRRTLSTSTSSSSSSSAKSPSSPPRRKEKVSGRTKEIVSTNSITLNSIIPDFDPLRDDVNAWLNIIQSYAKTFTWSDETIRYQALNKLRGSAKVWYDSLLRTEERWPSWNGLIGK